MGQGAWIFVAAVALLPACGTDTPAEGPGGPCTRTSDCQRGLICLEGFCAAPDASGGEQPDARDDGGSAGDSGAIDAGGAD